MVYPSHTLYKILVIIASAILNPLGRMSAGSGQVVFSLLTFNTRPTGSYVGFSLLVERRAARAKFTAALPTCGPFLPPH